MSLRSESPSGAGANGISGKGATGACYVLLADQTGKTLQAIRSSLAGQRLHSDLSGADHRQSLRNVCLPGTIFREAEEKEVIDFFNPSRTKTTLVLKSVEVGDLFIAVGSTDDVERVTSDEMCLLLGVVSCTDRLRILRDKMLLDDLVQLQMGENVLVIVDSSEELDGFLRYKGPVSSLEPAYIFGVELVNHPGRGNSDGTYQKRSYFQVAPNCAIFVGAHRVRALRQSSPRRRRDNDRQQQQQQQQQPTSTPLAIGERIVWMADNGPEFGTVKWIGILEDVSEDWTVGVEFDNAVGTGTGKYRNEQLFRARMNHASLIPVLGLVKEADFLGTHSSAAAAAAFRDAAGGGGGGINVVERPVFSEDNLDLIADGISKHDWPSVADHLNVPSSMLGDVSSATILRWWWQSGSMMETGATSRFALLLDALQRAGKYTFAAELKRNFVPDSLWGASSAAPAGLGGHATHENEKRGSLSNGLGDSSIVDTDHLRSDEKLMREQEMVLSNARQQSNNNISARPTPTTMTHGSNNNNSLLGSHLRQPLHQQQQQQHQQRVDAPSSSSSDRIRTAYSSRTVAAEESQSRPSSHGGLGVVDHHSNNASSGGGGAPRSPSSASSSSMNPLYDLSALGGFVSATQIMDDRERKNKDLLANNHSNSSAGTPRAARQARASLTPSAPPPPHSTTSAYRYVSSPAASSSASSSSLNGTGVVSPSRFGAGVDEMDESDVAADDDDGIGSGRGFADSRRSRLTPQGNGFVDERFNAVGDAAASAASALPMTSSVLMSSSTSSSSSSTSAKLEVGSLVEVDLSPHQNQCGVIRWIGNIAKSDNRLCLAAGLEMDEEDSTFTDGTFQSERFFSCAPNRALFIPLSRCKLDSRFQDQDVVDNAKAIDTEVDKDLNFGNVDSPVVTGNIPPPSSLDLNLVSGNYKGIQGHHNSCYLDATLFSMFAFSAVFDQVLYRPANGDDIPQYAEIQRVLKECIVNPLRRHFYVRADRTMQLRRLLDRLSDVDGMVGEEKDPEEFLRSLLEQTLKMEPLIRLTSDQKAYFYQIFVEKDESLLVPTIQQLFEKSMFQSSLRFTQAPACLIIQMPRYGKDFKMFKRIIPSLELDISDVIDNSPRECNLCHNPAHFECRDCYRATSPPIPLRYTAYCEECMAHHQYREPGDSTPPHKDCVKLSIPATFKKMRVASPNRPIPRISMELFAVLCINTSHYVAFVKAGGRKSFARMQEMLASLDPELARGGGGSSSNGCNDGVGPQPEDGQWLFFDSMAGRVGLKNGYNIPRVIYVEDFTDWASDGKRALIEESVVNERLLPEHIARLLGDAYMCFYQDPYQIDAL